MALATAIPIAGDPGGLEPRGAARSLADALTGDAQVHPEERVQAVAQLFFDRPSLDAVALVEDGRPAGLLTRGRLLVKLARNFGRELYARKPVTRIADLSPLLLPAGTPLGEAVERALSRKAETVFDEVIVTGAAGRFLGYASVRELAQQQGRALERSALEHEAAIGRARDLERLERARAQFLAHATHELRSPVHAIAALAELLRMACDGGDLERVRAKVPLLLRAAAALRGTVNNVLDLSKLEHGAMHVAAGPVHLATLADEVAAHARLLVGSRPVEVATGVAADLVIETDAQKLRQILVNLASNAAKFTERGRVVLRAARAPHGGVAVSVSDTGCGIGEQDLQRLFVPFGQLEDAATKTHEGTGLGLVITRSLAALLGGAVRVESRRGEGSTFTVELPATPPRRTSR